MDESEVVESSEQTGDTSVPEESTSQVEASDAEVQASTPEKTQEEKPAPFHEHPRFKELIEQNRSFKEEAAQRSQAIEFMQRELQNLRQLQQQQMAPKQETPVDPFIADLEKVNPEYAKSLKSMYERASKTEQLEQRLAQYEQSQFAEKAYNHFNNLLSSNKVADPMDQELYKNVVEAEVYRREAKGEKLGLKDLDGIFNQFHTKYSKAMEERNRKLTASYVSSKKSDIAPKSTTGGAATSSSVKKIAAGDISAQAKWLADNIRAMKKQI